MDWPRVIGHRGAAGHAPENTLDSLEAAARLGCAMVEFDVALSADRVPVLFHDARLERCTDGTGPLAARTVAQLKELDAGGGARIPTLAEALALCHRRRLAVDVEIKPAAGAERDTVAQALDVIAQGWPASGPSLVLSSFSADALDECLRRAPQWPRLLLVVRLGPRGLARAKRLGCVAIGASQARLTGGQVTLARQAGMEVLAYTVNSDKRARTLWRQGVAAVFSDHPGRLSAAVS